MGLFLFILSGALNITIRLIKKHPFRQKNLKGCFIATFLQSSRLYFKHRIFFINGRTLFQTYKSFKSYPQPTQLLLIWLSYEVYQRHSHGIVLHSS